MILTVMVGILVNNANIDSLRSDLQRIEGALRSELQRVERVLSTKIDALATCVKVLEDEIHSPLVKL
jgi:uncharacterized protein involved in exopolysaccharide biosynthesis